MLGECLCPEQGFLPRRMTGAPVGPANSLAKELTFHPRRISLGLTNFIEMLLCPEQDSPVGPANSLAKELASNPDSKAKQLAFSLRCLAVFVKLICLEKMFVSRAGFEPATYGLEGRCSIQLSYRDKWLSNGKTL